MGFLNALMDKLLNQKSPSEMSDKELQRKLDRGVGKNTGESIATRAAYVKEGHKRGINANQDEK